MVRLRITSLSRIQENMSRWSEIGSILVKYGFRDVVAQLDLGAAGRFLNETGPGADLADISRAERIRLALAEIGTSGIKLGQILSTRGDLVGAEVARELETLQADAPADPPEVARAVIEAELGHSVDALFARFDDRPMASASIAQVHAAWLPGGGDGDRSEASAKGGQPSENPDGVGLSGADSSIDAGMADIGAVGEAVVIKVRHPGIERQVRVDLAILGDLAQLAEHVPELANYRPTQIFREFRRTLLRELDFGSEAAHMQRIAGIFRAAPLIRIPRVYRELSTSRVLTMERLDGIQLSDVAALRASGMDLDRVARRGAEMYMEMILGHGFYHADPHPGNLLVMENGAIGLLDYGMIGRLDTRTREDIEDLMLAVLDLDAERMTELVIRMAESPPDLDARALAWELDEMVSNYASQPVERFDMSGALRELLTVVRGFHLVLPANVSMLIKVLVMLEGSGRLLSPSFNLIQAMQPYRRKLVARRLDPRRQLRKLQRIQRDMDHLLEALPTSMLEALDLMRHGRFHVHLDHRGLSPSVNRLVLGLLASSLFLGSSMLLAFEVPPMFAGLSAPGSLGALASLLIGLRLLRAIAHSGRLDGE